MKNPIILITSFTEQVVSGQYIFHRSEIQLLIPQENKPNTKNMQAKRVMMLLHTHQKLT